MFEPATIPDESCAEGHLDRDPIYAVLLTLSQQRITGRLTIDDAAGPNHMFFMQGRPVGVHLAEHFHPIGQLLLELGRMNGATFVKAQRTIAEGNRLPGQVYKEFGILDESALKDVLQIQARRKAEHFCRLGSRAFQFCRGLTFLNGFTSTPLDVHHVTYTAVKQQMGEQAREAWIEGTKGQQVRVVEKPGSTLGLPAPLIAFGFGAPEERFLQRVLAGWETVHDLAETGTLPREEMACLLRYLEVLGRLERRETPRDVPAPRPADDTPTLKPSTSFILGDAPLPAPRPAPVVPRGVPPSLVTNGGRGGPAPIREAPLAEITSEEVFARPTPAPAPATNAPSTTSAPPVAPPVVPPAVAPIVAPVVARTPSGPIRTPQSTRPMPSPPTTPRPTTAPIAPRPVERAPEARPAPVPPAGVAGPAEQTDPRRPRPVRSTEKPAAAPAPPAVPPRPAAKPTAEPESMVFATAPSAPVPTGPVAAAPGPIVDDFPAPVVKKKKVKRTEALPSEGSGIVASETRGERESESDELPSIVIED